MQFPEHVRFSSSIPDEQSMVIVDNGEKSQKIYEKLFIEYSSAGKLTELLNLSAKSGCFHLVEYIIEKASPKLKVNVCDLIKESSNVDILRYVMSRCELDDNSLDYGVIVSANPAMIDVVLSSIDLNKQDRNGNTIFHMAINRNKIDVLEMLLRIPGVDLNTPDRNGNTLLHTAIKENKTEIVKMLLKSPGIELNIEDDGGNTLLHRAIKENDTEMVEMLLNANGIRVNIKNRFGNTPLHRAIKENKTEIVKMLLKSPGINVNIKDNDGNTPLELAGYNAQTEIVNLLKNKEGARPAYFIPFEYFEILDISAPNTRVFSAAPK
jgi:hypothetical protein